MRAHRLFFAIELPREVKKRLLMWVNDYQHLPVRWVREDALHITLLFIGESTDEEMVRLATGMQEAVSAIPSFDLTFTHIAFAPSPAHPRMVWHVGEPNEHLARIIGSLERFVQRTPASRDPRPVRPHITLGRIREGMARPATHTPALPYELRDVIPVHTITLFESELRREGPTYYALEHAAFA